MWFSNDKQFVAEQSKQELRFTHLLKSFPPESLWVHVVILCTVSLDQISYSEG